MIDEPARALDEGALRALVPRVLAGLVRRGEDFDAAEDALQEALLEALRAWPGHPPQDPPAAPTAARLRRPHHARDRRRLLCPGGDHGAADQPGQAGAARAPPGPAR